MKQGKKWSLCSTNMSSPPHFFISQSLGLSSVSPSALYLISLASSDSLLHILPSCPVQRLSIGISWIRASGTCLLSETGERIRETLGPCLPLFIIRANQSTLLSIHFLQTCFHCCLLYAVFSGQAISSVLHMISLCISHVVLSQ